MGDQKFIISSSSVLEIINKPLVIIIIISLLQSTAGHRPLQSFAISLGLRLLASSFCQPSCANRHSTWPEGVLHYVYLDGLSTPELVYSSGYRFWKALAAFAVVSTHQHTLGHMVGYGPFPLCVFYKEGLWTSSGDINRQMIRMWYLRKDLQRRGDLLPTAAEFPLPPHILLWWRGGGHPVEHIGNINIRV
jgi:hypothetical protein